MKKFFTLICAMICAVAANAASVDDIAVCKHSYVMVADDYTGGNTVPRVKGKLFGDGFFLDVTGGSIATNKQQIDLSDETWSALLPGYAEYGKHYNSLRLKAAQDVIACRVNEGTKIIVLGQAHASRFTQFSSSVDMKTLLPGQTGEANSMIATYVAQKDNELVYIGAPAGDYYISYIIIEANEPLGTPSVKVGPQTYEGGLWFKEVTCTPKAVVEGGESLETYCTYSINGGDPVKYEAPIKVYSDSKVAFQAYYEWDEEVPGAENEAVVSFKFDAPTVACENGTVTVSSAYEGAKNMISLNGGEFEEANTKELDESAVVTAKSVIVNGTYATFETMPTSIDALVLTPITEEVTVTVSGDAVLDEEATAISTTGPVYVIENGVINADKMQFFNKGMQFKAIATADAKNAKYQVPEGQEAYMMFGNDSRLYFEIGCDTVDVEVICSKNSCKTLNEDDDETVTTDRKCFVNVSGKTYGFDNCEYDEDGKTVKSWTPAAEIKTTINFGLKKGSYYFAKYSGTGNILLYSIKITPAEASGIKNVTTASAAKVVKAIENGQLVIKSVKGTFNVAGAQMK